MEMLRIQTAGIKLGRKMIGSISLKGKKSAKSVKRVGLVATIALSVGIALPAASNAEPKTVVITVDAQTYAGENPTSLTSEFWIDERGGQKVYKIYGASTGDTFIFNLSNVSNMADTSFYEMVGYFQNNEGFLINLLKTKSETLYSTGDWMGDPGFKFIDTADLDSYYLEVTLGEDPALQNQPYLNLSLVGVVGFPSDSNSLYYMWEIYSSSAPVSEPEPAPVALRQTANLSFSQSQYGSDTLSDPNGELRKTLDSINAKYGYLVK